MIRGPLISDTLQALQGWDLEASKRADLDQAAPDQQHRRSYAGLAEEGLQCPQCPLRSCWTADRALVLAARSGTGQRHWKPLLLWHMANSESLLGEGLSWTWEVFSAGGDLIQTDQALAWLEGMGSQGHPEVADWSEATRKRVAGGLLKAGVGSWPAAGPRQASLHGLLPGR